MYLDHRLCNTPDVDGVIGGAVVWAVSLVCHCAVEVLSLFAALPLLYCCPAAALSLLSRRSVSALLVCCHCVVTVLPLCCHSLVAALLLLCRCSIAAGGGVDFPRAGVVCGAGKPLTGPHGHGCPTPSGLALPARFPVSLAELNP